MIAPLSKYQNGRSLAEHRLERKAGRKAHEDGIKAELRQRDGKGCRWPGCRFAEKGVRVDGVHLIDKGMGGDPLGIRTKRRLMIRLCAIHHVGAVSIHSGDLDVIFLTARGTDGPVQFLRKNPKAKDGWEIEASEDEHTITKLAELAKRAWQDDGDEAEL